MTIWAGFLGWRLSRCRLVLPDDAGIGFTPHREAKAASERSRSGLLPAAINSVAAVSGPTPKVLISAGAIDRVSLLISDSRSRTSSPSWR